MGLVANLPTLKSQNIHIQQQSMKSLFPLLALTSLLALPFSTGIAKPDSGKASIYERLGGQPAIDAAVELFYKKVLADKKVNHFFEDVNMNRQKNKQKQFLAAAFGGPNPWKGKDMRSAHKHL